MQSKGLTWEEFKDSLIQAFDALDELDEQEKARYTLFSLRMNETLGVEAYYMQFMTLMAKLEVPPTVPDQIYAFRRGLSKRLQRLTACDPANGMQGYTDFYRLANCALASGKLGAQEFIVDAMGKNGEFDSFNERVKKGAGQRPKAHGKGPHTNSSGKPSMRNGRGVGIKRRHDDAEAGTSAEGPRCYACQGMGHIAIGLGALKTCPFLDLLIE